MSSLCRSLFVLLVSLEVGAGNLPEFFIIVE
jgi:hypothetical protein